MDDGSWFHASGPAYENDRSPNFVGLFSRLTHASTLEKTTKTNITGCLQG